MLGESTCIYAVLDTPNLANINLGQPKKHPEG